MVGEGEAEDAATVSSTSSDTVESSQAETPESPQPQVQYVLLSASLDSDTISPQFSVIWHHSSSTGNRKG